MADAGDLLFPGGVPLDQAVPGHLPAEGLAEPGIGKVGANKVDGRAPAAQINGQAGLMLAVAGICYVSLGKGEAVFRQGVLPNGLLLFQRPPAADGHNLLPASDGGHQAV
mgnify:CR=1 FL=1